MDSLPWPDYLETMFMSGKTIRSETTFYDDVEQPKCAMSTKDLGLVAFPTGKILACDPSLISQSVPYQQSVAPGDYPVQLAIAHFVKPDDRRVAGAMIRFAAGRPISWTKGLLDDKALAFGVDSGIACLADARNDDLKGHIDEAFEAIQAQMDANSSPSWTWGSWSPAPGRPAAMVMFGSGLGDGFYDGWWGLSKQKEPLCLVVNFRVFEVH